MVADVGPAPRIGGADAPRGIAPHGRVPRNQLESHVFPRVPEKSPGKVPLARGPWGERVERVAMIKMIKMIKMIIMIGVAPGHEFALIRFSSDVDRGFGRPLALPPKGRENVGGPSLRSRFPLAEPLR